MGMQDTGRSAMNKQVKVPDTYVIIFFVVLFAALLTYLIPKGSFETKEVTYTLNGAQKTRTVVDAGPFKYVTDAAGKAVLEGVALFAAGGHTGFAN